MKNIVVVPLVILALIFLLINCDSITNVKDTNFAGYIDTTDISHSIPSRFKLDSPYPNPFDDQTNFSVSISAETKITIVIQNPIGDVVKVLFAQKISPGYYRFTWDGTNDNNKKVKNGKYFVTLEVNSRNFIQSHIIKYEN